MTNSPESTYRQLKFGIPVATREYFNSLSPEIVSRIYFRLHGEHIGFPLVPPIDEITTIINYMNFLPQSATEAIYEVFDSIIEKANECE